MSGDELTDQLADRVKRFSAGMRAHEPVDGNEPIPFHGVDEKEFWSRVKEETKRSDRYDHPFTVLVVRSSGEGERASNAQLLAAIAPGLVRECDITSQIDRGSAIGVLLPETGVAGAAALVERIRAQFADAEACEVTLLEYPATKERLEALARAA